MFTSSPSKIKLNASALVKVRTAEILEKDVDFPASEGRAATEAAWHELGEKASPASVVLNRAEKVIRKARDLGLRIPEAPEWHPAWLTAGLSVLAFMLGALLEQIAGTGDKINLLSPPLLFLLLWNIVVYLLLFVLTLRRPWNKGKSTWARHLFSELIRLLKWYPLKGREQAKALSERLLDDYQPLFSLWSARAFHLGALCFAIGIVVSTFVRGIGTEWLVGWESTWFLNKPEWVTDIFHLTYGLIPGGSPITLESVEALQFGAAHYANTEPALWILRILGFLSIVVIIPRLILVLWGSWKISRAKKRFVLNTQSDYFKAIFKAKNQQGNLVFIVPTQTKAAWQPLLETVQGKLDHSLRQQNFDIWADDFETLKVALMEKAPSRVMLGWTANMTPEPEVHGKMLSTIANIPHPLGWSPILLLDTQGLDEDHAQTRMAQWKNFAQQYDCQTQAIQLDSTKLADALKLIQPLMA